MRSLRFCALVVLVLAASLCASGQTLPPITADDQMGFQPFQSFHGGAIDHIGLANGTVGLDYPFASYPQRGSLHLDFHLYYNNNPQHFALFCPPPVHGQQPACFFWWGWTPTPGSLPLEKGDVFVGWAQQLVLNGTNMNVVFNAGYSDQYQDDYTRWSLQTADGAMHALGNLGTMSMTGSSPEYFASYTGPWETLDATGWRVNGSMTTTRGDYSSSHSASGAVDGNGTIAGTQDANGNVIGTSLNSQGMAAAFTDTLGRSISAPPTASSPSNTGTSACPSGALPVDHAVQWSVPGPGGGTSTFTFCYVKVSVNIPPGPGTMRGPANTNPTNLQSIVLPDGHSWSFQYNDPGDGSTYNGAPVNYGTLTQISLPMGGTISYTYTTTSVGGTCQNGGRFVASRTVNANDGTGNHTWTYSYVTTNTGNNSSPWSVATTVTDPLGNQTVHTFNSLFAQDNCPAYEAQTKYYQGSQNGGALLKTVNTIYSYILGDNSLAPLNVVPTQITTVWANGKTATVSKSYDSGYTYSGYRGGTSTGIYGKELSESATDYGNNSAGPTLKITNTSYLALSNSNYLTANLLDLVSSQQITDGGGNQFAKTTYGYDESSLQSSGVTTQLGAPPNSVRGNLTSSNRWLNTTGANVTTSSKWFDSGELYQAIDALGNPATHSYDLAYAGAFSTKTTNALSQTVSGTYDFNTGLLTSFTDANGSYQASGNTPGDPAHTTSLQYNDPMWRLTEVQSPADPSGNHPVTTINYPDANTVERLKTITSSLTDDAYGYFDGVGRHYKGLHVTANNSTAVTTYDADGRTASVTNPYITTSDPTYGVTQTQYDGIGRVTKTTKQDNSVVTAQYNQTSTNSPNGDCSLTTDEAGRPRKACVDGLGRLIEVDEPQASSGSMTNPYVTLYTYDALGNLLSVNQKGDGSQAARQRSFTYDSLSRLLTATNPESGQISYSYDANGNVLQKTSPAPNQTGSATQTISYCYDKLNRVTGKAYAAQSCPLSSPVVTYSYDSGTNGIGHLTSLTDQAGSGSYSYDALGRIASEQRTIAGNSKTLSYTYNLDNSVATLTYPSGAVVTYTPDAAGRTLSAVDVANNINYVTGATYGPDNSLTGFLGGQSNSFAGISNSFSYNPRLQPSTMAAVAPDCTGTGCSASVTISGSLGTAASTTGTPLPNAASGSALSGYEDSAGLNHWLYEGTNDHLYEVYWNNNGSGRGYADATVETGGPLAAQTTALSTYLDNSQVPHWIYEDGAQHMQLFWIYSGTWGSLDNTTFVGSPAMATGTALTSKEDTNCLQHWAFFGSNKDLYEMHHSGTNGCLGAGVSGYSDGTAATGTPPAAPGSAMSMYFDNSQIAHWIYEDSNQHIQLLWWLSSGSWGNLDVTTTTGGPVAAAGSALTSREDTNCLQHWAYFGTNQHLYDAYHDDSSGCTGTPVSGYSDGTAATGAPPAAPGSALSMYFDNNQVAHWIYEDSAQHIQLLWYAGGSWGHLDITATAGSPLAAPGSALASGEDTSCLQRWLYFGSNQHLYEVHVQGNAGGGCSGSGVWGYSDVTAATPSEAIDSGTVSLSVGNFTATACFGSSTNPACTGQPVNDNAAQVAAALAQALNGTGSPVTATASGATINMTWKASGAATPVSPMSTTHDNPNLFPGPSFTSGAASFGGGTGGNLSVFSISYNFNLGSGDNGNVSGITNNRDTTRSQSFTYDYLNRLTSAQNSGTNCSQMTVNGKTEYWGNSYGYDAWGNLLQKNVTKCSAENLSVSVLGNNQLVGYGYDAAGNMTHDATTNVNYTFDAENRITGAAGYTYTYDADGNRVEKSNGNTGTIYWYMSPGIVAESDLSGNLKSEYVFFDGDRVARKDFSGGTTSVAYYFSDHLKTASVITNSAGVITEDGDYYPWGGELQFVNSDSNHYKFIGKERDAETGLDYFGARYYGNWYGRFLSPDWADKPEAVPYSDLHDPQSLNLYSYVRNVPTSRADPDGHCAEDACIVEGGVVIGALLVKVVVGVSIGVTLGYVWDKVTGRNSIAPPPPPPPPGTPSHAGAQATSPPPPGQGNKDGKKGDKGDKKVRRPYIRKSTRAAVEAKTPRTENGKPIDPNTGQAIEGKPDLGHVAGSEHWREAQQAESEGLTQQQFNDRMNDPSKYQLEDSSSNRSHQYEQPRDQTDKKLPQ